MYSDLTDIQKKLADFMSDLSEIAYSAGWMHNLEYSLWDAVLNGGRRYGHYFITNAEIDMLVKLSGEANCWIYFDNESEETAVPVGQWNQKFNDDVFVNPKLVKG